MHMPLTAGSSRPVLLLATLLTLGCTEPIDPKGPEDVALIERFGGVNQVGEIGSPLPEAIRVRALDAAGEPVAGIELEFLVTRGDGHLIEASDITDRNGIGEGTWVLGGSIGEDSLEVFVPGSTAAAAAIGATVLPAILDLGTLPGHASAYALAVNESGLVVGFSSSAHRSGVPFGWTREGGMRELTSLGGGHSVAVDVNEAGQIVGSARDGMGVPRAVLWADVGAAPEVLQVPGYSSGAMSINGFGEVLVRTCSDALCTEQEYYLWASTSAVSVESPCTDFTPTDRNDLGQIAGVAHGGCTATSPERVVVHGSTVTVLRGGPLELARYSTYGWPIDMNDRGEVIAEFRETIASGAYRYWSGYWTVTGGLHELPETFRAREINDLGEVAGSALSGNSFTAAALWRDGRVYILGSLMDRFGGVSGAVGLNNSGVVVGSSRISAETAERRATAWLVGPPRPE